MAKTRHAMQKDKTAKPQKKDIKLAKIPTGISGLDEMLDGGLPKNRTTLITGGAGSGKTIFGMEFLVKGAADFNEPGVFIAFEEKVDELIANVASFGYDMNGLIAKKKIYIEHVAIANIDMIETGEFNLEGVFVRLEQAIDKIGAKRIVLDSLDALFYKLNYSVMRKELNRLFIWLKNKGVTAILIAEAGENSPTRKGLEEYVADCVLLLNNRVTNQMTTRRLRILKYRGSSHGTNEYPFTITEKGIAVFPVIPQVPDFKVSDIRISSGIKELDEMMEGKGFFKGSSILVSGSAGSGKSSIAASLINDSCKKKDKCLYCAFEETPKQIIRNMASIGIKLEPHVKSGHLQFYNHQPTLQNLELHLIKIQQIIDEFKPKIVVLDPITNIMTEGINSDIRYMLVKFVDYVKSKQITVLFTAAITLETIKSNTSDEGISSMVDTWALVKDIEKNGERNRCLYLLKSRGMKHSAQVREFIITDKGITLIPAFIGDGEILTGSSKTEFESKEKTKLMLQENEIKKNNREIERQRKVLEAEVAKLKAQFESTKAELCRSHEEERITEEVNIKVDKKLEHLRTEMMV